jgi:hypothetical protein
MWTKEMPPLAVLHWSTIRVVVLFDVMACQHQEGKRALFAGLQIIVHELQAAIAWRLHDA